MSNVSKTTFSFFIQDNSRNEWAFQKAIIIQTYRYYHPVPVPFNIVTIFAVVVLWLCKKCKGAIKKAAEGHGAVPENETDGECLNGEAKEEDEKAQEKTFNEVSLKSINAVSLLCKTLSDKSFSRLTEHLLKSQICYLANLIVQARRMQRGCIIFLT